MMSTGKSQLDREAFVNSAKHLHFDSIIGRKIRWWGSLWHLHRAFSGGATEGKAVQIHSGRVVTNAHSGKQTLLSSLD